MAAPAVCPNCASDDIFFSAIAMQWKCSACNHVFDGSSAKKESTKSPAAKKQAEVGTQSGGYSLLDRGKAKDGTVYTLWKSPAGRSFRIEEEYPKKGKLIDSFKDEDSARNRLKELVV